jgi:hypothetical protein
MQASLLEEHRDWRCTYMGVFRVSCGLLYLIVRGALFISRKQQKRRIKKRSIKLRFAMSTHTHVLRGNAQLTLLFLGGGSPTSLGQTYLS